MTMNLILSKMKNNLFGICLVLGLFVNAVCTHAQTTIRSGNILDYSDFESAMPPVRYGGNPIMKHGGWAEGQLQEPCILVNPKDSSKLIMFYAGMNLISTDGGKGAISKAWAYKTNPYVWYEFPGNPILTPDPAIPFEELCIRLDCILYNADNDEYWIYYTGIADKHSFHAIGLAVCSTGADGYSMVTRDNIKRYSGNPILTGPGQGRDDGTHVSQSAILFEEGIYYMYYSYRGDEVLPGIRYATSKDGKVWIKKGAGDLLSRGPEGSPDSRYFEWKQVFKAFDKNILIWEAFNGKEWAACMASSDSPAGPWIKSTKNPIFRPSGVEGSFDKYFTATPAFYLINNKWYFYYVGAGDGGNYNYNTWDMGAAELIMH